MNIAWVTPFSEESAIGRFSRLVVSCLHDLGHEVTVIRSECVELLQTPHYPVNVEVLPWTALRENPRSAGGYDVFVHNIGNYYPFHAGNLELLDLFGGTIVFHDFYLLNLFHGWRASVGRTNADFVLEACYGRGSAGKIDEALSKPDHLSYTALRFPMTEWLARLADGAVAHSGFYLNRLYASCPGPVTVIPLAYDSLGHFTPTEDKTPSQLVTVLTFGNINPNKRVASVMRAIGGSNLLRSRVDYKIVGLIDDSARQALRTLATEAGLSRVTFTGQVSDAALHEYLDCADIICCLRWPALEGASASAIEAMLTSRPVLVTDTGFYSELPNDLVFKVRPEHEIEDISRHLELLVESPRNGAIIGRRAASYATRIFSTDSYASSIVSFLNEVIEGKPLVETSRRIGRMLGNIGLRSSDPALDSIAGTMRDLFRAQSVPFVKS
jgi:glycosyltransferase involved in cell wall biosynthesis